MVNRARPLTTSGTMRQVARPAQRGWKVKWLWDEWRLTKQVTCGAWWLITEPDPPLWFRKGELGRRSHTGADSLFW